MQLQKLKLSWIFILIKGNYNLYVFDFFCDFNIFMLFFNYILYNLSLFKHSQLKSFATPSSWSFVLLLPRFIDRKLSIFSYFTWLAITFGDILILIFFNLHLVISQFYDFVLCLRVKSGLRSLVVCFPFSLQNLRCEFGFTLKWVNSVSHWPISSSIFPPFSSVSLPTKYHKKWSWKVWSSLAESPEFYGHNHIW